MIRFLLIVGLAFVDLAAPVKAEQCLLRCVYHSQTAHKICFAREHKTERACAQAAAILSSRLGIAACSYNWVPSCQKEPGARQLP
jgi:hypothetical protein